MMSWKTGLRAAAALAAIATLILAGSPAAAMYWGGLYGSGWHDGWGGWHHGWHGDHAWGGHGGHWQSWHHRVVIGSAWPYYGYYGGYPGFYSAYPSYSVDDYAEGNYSGGDYSNQDSATDNYSSSSSVGEGYTSDSHASDAYTGDNYLGSGDGSTDVVPSPPYDGAAHPDGY